MTVQQRGGKVYTLPQGIHDRLQELIDKIQQEDSSFAIELKVMYWFHAYAHEAIAQLGGQEVGFNFRQRETMCLLVYKAKFGDTQQVVFTTARDSITCMVSFCRRLFANTLDWKKDKYA